MTARPLLHRLIQCARALRADRRGVAAVEFALIAPIFCVMLVAAVDFGGVLHTKFELDSAISAGANYALVNAAQVSSTNGASLGNVVATIVETSQGSGWANDSIVVNNGPSTTVNSGASTASGTASNADSCYCPSLSSSTVTWGAAATCGASCPAGGVAGKFVQISASHTYQPMFSSYGLVQNSSITSSAFVQVQ